MLKLNKNGYKSYQLKPNSQTDQLTILNTGFKIMVFKIIKDNNEIILIDGLKGKRIVLARVLEKCSEDVELFKKVVDMCEMETYFNWNSNKKKFTYIDKFKLEVYKLLNHFLLNVDKSISEEELEKNVESLYKRITKSI